MRDRLWTKDFTIDVCINFLLYVIMYQLMLWSTQFAIHTWDATVSEAGLASGIFIIGALSSRIVTGHVIDALGRKKALLVGTGIYMLGLLLYFPVHSLTAFLVIRCLHGAAYGISARRPAPSSEPSSRRSGAAKASAITPWATRWLRQPAPS